MKKFLSLVGVFALSLLVLVSCGKKYTINFDVTPDFDAEYNGTTVEAMKFEEGVTFEAPIPTWEGYAFCGWYLDSGSLEEGFNFEAPEAGNVTVYAKWRVEIKLETNCDIKLDSIYNSPFDLITLPAMERDGYAMVGWYANADFTEAVPTLTPESGISVYAKWLKLDEASKFELTSWEIQAEEKPAYTKTDNADGSVTFTATENKLEYSLVKNVLGSNLKGYTVVVMNVKGTGEILPKLQNGGIVVKEQKFELTGEKQKLVWVFDTTVLENSGQSTDEMILFFLNPGKTGAGAEVTIYDAAIYRTLEGDATSGTAILFNTNGGSVVNPIVAEAGATIEAPTAPEKDGYAFAGWYTNAECEGDAYTFTTMPEENVELYAKWEIAALISRDILTDTYVSNDEGSIDVTRNEAGALVLKKNTLENNPETDWDESDNAWAYVKSTLTGSAVAGYKYLYVTVKGVKDQVILFKVNDNGAAQAEVKCTGEEQTVVIDLSGLKVNENGLALIMFVGAGTKGESGEFVVSQLTLSTYKFEQSILEDTYVSNDEGSINVTRNEDGALVLKKNTLENNPETDWDDSDNAWAFVKSTLTGSAVAGYKYLYVTVKGVKDQVILFKVNDNGAAQAEVKCTGEEQTVIIDLSNLKVNESGLALIMFVGAGTKGESGEFVVSQLTLTSYKFEQDILEDTYVSNDEGSIDVTRNEDGSLVLKKNTLENNPETDWDDSDNAWAFVKSTLTGSAVVGYKYLTITVKGVKDQVILFKVNDNGAAQAEVKCTGEEQTVVIDLSGLKVNENGLALIMFVGAGTKGESGEFVISQLLLSEVKEPLDVLTDTYVSNDEGSIDVTRNEDGSLVLKKNTLENNPETDWDDSDNAWAFVKSTLTGSAVVGYTSLTITVKGVKDQVILFKVNDNGAAQAEVKCTGEEQIVYIDLTNLNVNQNGLALIMFVGAGTKGESGEFVISSMVFGN